MRYFTALITAKRKKSYDRTDDEKNRLFWFKELMQIAFLVGIYLASFITYLIMEVF